MVKKSGFNFPVETRHFLFFTGSAETGPVPQSMDIGDFYTGIKAAGA
jgi:hypothetical protein